MLATLYGAHYWNLLKSTDTFVSSDGTIGFVELTHAIQKYSKKNDIAIPKTALKKLFDDLDQDHSGLIKYSEFIAACMEQNAAYSDGKNK